ncbi:MAG: TetR/AcrR family transcriptional regulator [Ketobacter sp.]|uniref:TetR/AcrR family transcriptional regulator n=1 Tax=Ketobacter sp. MCCC 1A13808 TaxID=2602738 RepID=UPI0018DEB347|nr:TetR/AcrR family transcriptional regulator [Ketobacter sp. MCCC 1A13808]
MPATKNKTSKRTYGGLSEEERIQDRRERFLAAGLEIFGTLGIKGATVRALCREAGLTERYFYESFSDTEALFEAVYEQQSNKLLEFYASGLHHLPESVYDKTVAALNLLFTIMRNDRMVRILCLESVAAGSEIADKHHAKMQLYAEVSVQLIRTLYPNLTLPDDVLKGIAFSLNGACFTVVTHWMLGGYKESQEAVVNSSVLVVQGTMQQLSILNQKNK